MRNDIGMDLKRRFLKRILIIVYSNMDSQSTVKCPQCNLNRDASGYTYILKICDKCTDTRRRYRAAKLNQTVFHMLKVSNAKTKILVWTNLK